MSVEDKISAYRRRKDARQKGNAYYNFKKRRAARKAEREDAKWITIGAVEPDERRGSPGMKGRHVLIDDEGKVLSGAGGSLTGVTLSGAESTSGDVKVDPKKTSDPLPTSPAGEEGKSSSEVAAEAKETESKGAESEEPKKESVKVDTETLKSVKGNKDDLKDWLNGVPEGTTIVFTDDDGGVGYKLEKSAGEAWTGTIVYTGETETFSDAANLATDLQITIGAFSSFGGDYKVVKPGEESEAGKEPSGEEPETKEGEFDISDFDAVKYDDGLLTVWLDRAPAETKISFHDSTSDEDVVIEKHKDGTWTEKVVGDLEGDETEYANGTELLDEMHGILSNEFAFDIVDGSTGEAYISEKAKEGETAKGEETKTEEAGGKEPEETTGLLDADAIEKALAEKDDDTYIQLLDKAPVGTTVEYLGKSFVKDADGQFYLNGKKEPHAGFTPSGLPIPYKTKGVTWGIIDPTTGEYIKLSYGSETSPAKIEEEPEKPYKAKDDLASAVTAFDEPTINKRLDEMEAGAEIIAETGYKTVRYTKQEDGSWKQESKYPWAGDDKWLGGYVKNNHDVALQMATAKNVSVDGKEMNRPAIHLLNATLLKLKTGDGNVEKMKEYIGLTNKDFAAVMKNMDGETVFITKQDDGTFDVKEGDKTRKLSDTDLVNLIKNKDLWLKTRLSEQGWAASGQSMLKKHLAPLKKSVLTSPDYNAFHDTLTAIKSGSTFQMRNTDGSGYVVRKMADGHMGEKGYVVKEIDKDGNIKDVEFFLEKEDTELHKKLSEAAKKGATFSADLDIGPYAPPEKKPAKKTYKGPADTSSHASEGKTSGGLSTVKFGEDAYSDAARKGAIQEPGTEEGKTRVHKELFPAMKEWWKNLSSSSKSSLRDYTGSYHDTNEPLRGYSYTSYTKDADHIRNKIKAIDDALEQTTMDKPIVLTRGISLGTFRAMVDHQSSSYSKWGPDSFGADLIGKEITEPSYMSCTAAGAADFSSKPVQLKIYCPTGTKGAYINPISSYGMKLSDSAVETSSPKSPASGSEFEFLLQRGCKFKVRNITKSGGKYMVELDLVEQNPRPMKVVGTKCVYDDGKDAYDF